MSTCDWIQTGDRTWQCVRCQRTIAVPEGMPVPPNFSAAPPCGWKPEIRRIRGHVWIEIFGSNLKSYSCPQCGIHTAMPDMVFTECTRRNMPKGNRITRYAEAVKKWASAGFPVRDKDEVQRIYEICKACPHYDKSRQTCRLCGCKCNTNIFPLMNKLRMATESCPDNPPRWTAAVD